MGRSYAQTKDQKSDGQRRDPRGPRHGVKGHKFDYHFNSPAILENRTRYPHTVGAHPYPPLKSGFNNSKIGKTVTKGKWKGMQLFTLTLEERATCGPCRHKLDCFGNKMLYAARQKHGPELETLLETQLSNLQLDHPQGFVVRLHVLGDFYSVDYVKFWMSMLDKFPAIRVYGYTARLPGLDDIGSATWTMFERNPDRVSMRWSDAPWMQDATVSIAKAEDAPPSSVVCPAQTEKSAMCATCGFCWDSRKNVAFLNH